MGAVIDYAGGETELSSGQWKEPKVLSIDDRDDWTRSLTPLVGQLLHIPHMTHRGQTAALVADTKQIYMAWENEVSILNTE